MKHITTLIIICGLLCAATASCKNADLSKTQTPKSNCETNLPPLVSAPEYVRRGANSLNEGRNGCALDDCEKAVELDAKNVEALTCRGAARANRRDFDAAESDFDAAVKLSANNPLILYRRAALYHETKHFDKALADINRTIELMPMPDNYEFRAEIYAETNDYENAAEDYTKAIRLKPDNPDYYLSRAKVFRRLGKNDLAAADEKKYRELGDAEKIQNTSETDKNDVILNDVAVSLPKPVYPPAARAVKASGKVKVLVSVDAQGNVVSAQAVSGHPLLRAAAERAAGQAKFKPSAIEKGVLVFDFAA